MKNKGIRWMLWVLTLVGIILGSGRLTQAAVTYDILSDSRAITKGEVVTYEVTIPVKSKVHLHFYGLQDSLRTYMTQFDLVFTNTNGQVVESLVDQGIELDDTDYEIDLKAGKYTMTLTAKRYSSSFAFNMTGTPTGKVPVKKLKLNTRKLTMKLNSTAKLKETAKLTATVTPYYSTETLRWSSSNKKVATVSQDGLVTPKGMGKTVIQVRSGKVTAKCNVYVTGGWVEYNVGKSRKLLPYVRNIEGHETGTWTSSRPAVVSLTKSVFTTQKQGKSLLRFVCNGKTYRLTVYSYDLKTLYPKAEQSLKEYWGDNDTPIVTERGYYTKKPGSIYLRYTTELYPEQVEEFYACYYKGEYYCGDEAETLIKQGK